MTGFSSLAFPFQIQIKSNSSNKVLGQMSLNASTTSVIINSLTTGGLYTARVAGLTRVGLGPFSSPTVLNMDPGQLTQLPPRTDPSQRNNASVVSETWFLILMITVVLTVIAALLGAVYVRRRQAMSKQLGHLNVPVGTANDICQLNKDTMWLERGWRPSNTLQASTTDKDCERKLLSNQGQIGLPPGLVGMTGSEYAEVNLTTFYNTRKQLQAPPGPYATTTLCIPARSPDSIETTGRKSNSSDSCLKPDYSSLDSNLDRNKSTVSPSSDNTSSVYSADDNTEAHRRAHQFRMPLPNEHQPPNWCDMLPPPPDHPPPFEGSLGSTRSHTHPHPHQHPHQHQHQYQYQYQYHHHHLQPQIQHQYQHQHHYQQPS